MKIAQIAPFLEHMPPRGTPDSERALSYLIEELVRRGHDVTLFGSGDSHLSAQLDGLCTTEFFHTPATWCRTAETLLAVDQMFSTYAKDFDIVHSHLGIDGFSMARHSAIPTLTTLYDRLDAPEYVPLFKQFRDLRLVSVSDAQRKPLSWASWQQTVHPGVPSRLFLFNPRPGTYLAFIGSLASNHGLGQAIELAKRTRLPLRVVSCQDGRDEIPFSFTMELLLDGHGIEWVGDLREEERNDFLGGAMGLICTPGNPGASALTVAEAFACGTPVLALQGGSEPEMIYDHVTGFVCSNLDELVDVMPLVKDLDRRECRRAFEKRFTAKRMADRYLQLYTRLLAVRSPWSSRVSDCMALSAAGCR